MRDEDGAVLLMVLIGLALMAALAGIALRLDRAGLRGLEAEAALTARLDAETSVLALLGSRLDALPQDGTPFALKVEGRVVTVALRRAEGLVNPSHARLPVLQTLLQARGAAPDQALALARAIRAAHVSDPAQMAALLPASLWRRIRPDVTFLGAAAGVNASAAPADLRDALAGLEAGVDFSQTPPPRGLYEIDLVLDPGGPVTRDSVLQDRAGRLHQIDRSWPMEGR